MRKKNYNFPSGEIILIDKPLEWTSFDVVKKIRGLLKRKLKVKKLKVGHAGTLDPLATGLLVICTGKKTKVIDELTGQDKSYQGKIQLGIETPSYDLETEISNKVSYDNISEADIIGVTKKLTGEIIQVPPIYSAKRVEGERAYKLARKGQEVALPGRKVNVHRFEISKIDLPEISFEIECSKGTYIRSIAHDMGKLLGNLGTLIELRRIKSGDFHINNAITISEFKDILDDLPDTVSIC